MSFADRMARDVADVMAALPDITSAIAIFMVGIVILALCVRIVLRLTRWANRRDVPNAWMWGEGRRERR